MNGRRQWPMPQGGAGYNPYSKYPDVAGLAQQFMQNMMMMKQMRQKEAQQEWERGMAQEQLKYQQLRSNIDLEREKRERERFKAEEKEKDREQKMWESLSPEEQKKAIRAKFKIDSGKPPKLTTFEQKKAHWDKKLANKECTQAEYDEAVWGVKSKPSVEDIVRKGVTARQANANWLSNLYKNAPIDKIIEDAKKAGVRPIVHGVRPDMPYKYNLAILNKEDRVETPEDLATILKYDEMFTAFMEDILPNFKNFKEFMKTKASKDKRISLTAIKEWFGVYK